MKLIGLHCHRAEGDILPETLSRNGRWCDAVYTADPDARTDGAARGPILDQAYADHGHDNWFLLMHADELWVTDPHAAIDANPDADGITVRLRLAFNPGAWNSHDSVLRQCTRALAPGWPEFRLFRGGPDVRYAAVQHFNVVPSGITRVGSDPSAIVNHYPYRSPEQQVARAAETWDPDNYRRAPLDADGIREWLLGNEHYRQEVAA